MRRVLLFVGAFGVLLVMLSMLFDYPVANHLKMTAKRGRNM
jgi:hypothetical protein